MKSGSFILKCHHRHVLARVSPIHVAPRSLSHFKATSPHQPFRWLFVLFLLPPVHLHADVGQSLVHFFKSMGGAGNASNPSVYKDQSAGFYTGGNLFARNSVNTSQLANIQLPSYKAGCGGIDLFMGSFSHISSSRLVEALKAIGSNMASYALLLGIETMSPQIKNIITELNDLVQKINQASINSCEIAATTLGSVWPRSDAAQGHLCKMIGTDGKYGGFSDYAAARQGCGAGGKRESVLESGKEDPRFKHMMAGPFNLVWKAIQQNAFLSGKGRLASFFMSLSGTLIRRKAGDSYEMRVFPSLVGRESLLSALLYGGEATIYRVHDEDGLDVREEKVHIYPVQSLVYQVKKLLLQIQQKIYDDQPLTAEELAFLNTTRLPFYKILNVATAYRRGGSPIDVLDYAELGAIDLLFQYLSEILDLVEESLTHLKAAAIDDSGIELFQNTLAEARRKVIRLRMGSFKQIEQILGIVAKTELLEKSLMVKAGALGEV